MTALPIDRTSADRSLIEDAIAKNGAIRVLFAASLAVLRESLTRKPRPPDASDLSAHLRRDVGLWKEPEAVDWRHFRP